MKIVDPQSHPKITVKRKFLGMDYMAGMITSGGGIMFIICAGIGMMQGFMVVGLIVGFAVAFAVFLFARKFFNNRPATYMTDWSMSIGQEAYDPTKRKKV